MRDSRGMPRKRRSPQEVRLATFSQRRRGGWEPDEVREFLASVADDIQAANEEFASLLAENERLRAAAFSSSPDMNDRTEANNQAIALLSQAQLVADQLVADHEQHSRHLLSDARAKQRELLDRSHEPGLPAALEGSTRGYVVPVPEIEYVRTFTQIAQGQLRSVLEALSEQVDRLGDLPRLDEGNNHHNGRNNR